MTVYAFSTENWRRPLDEVRFLMRFNESLLLRRRDDLNERGVRVRFIGRRGGRVPGRVRQHIADTEALTAKNRRMTLTFAFNYGGRAELVDAVRDIAEQAQRGKLRPGSIDERTIARHLYAPDMPDPDVLVRTSGEFRISNYLLVGAGLRRARVHRRALARLPARGPLRRDPRVPGSQPSLRRDRRRVEGDD